MNDTITLLGQQVPVALVLVYLQNWLKQSRLFPWITYNTTRVNNLVAIVLAGFATIGIHVVHSGTLSGGGTLTLTIPPLSVLLASLWHWLEQYILAKTAHTALQSQLTPKPTVADPVPVVIATQK